MTIAVQKLPIDELCVQVTSGGTPSRKNAEYWQNGNINWLKTGELNDWYVGESEEKINQKGLDGSSAKLFPANTVLMAMYGDGKTITTLGVLNRPATTNQACCAMIVDGAKCNYLYLLYALKHHRNELLKLVVAGAQRNLSTGIIKKFPVTYFPLPKQERIADYLSSYDKLIENNRRRIQLLEESARLLYQEWFVHLRFPGHEQVKITDGVPEGWVSGVVSDFFDTSSGGTPSRKIPEYYTGDIPWVKTQELNDGYIFNTSERITEEAIKKSSAKLFPAGTVLIAMYGATIGETGVLAVDAASNQACCALFPKHEELTPEFTHLFAMHSKQGLINLSQGAAQNNISQQVVRNYPFIMPSELLLKEFNEVVSNIYKQKANLEKQNASLARARDLLLPKLMSGELTI